VTTPHRNFRHDLQALIDAITPKTKIIYLDNPNNPTGTMLSQEEMDRFMARIPDGVLVVLDDAYHEYVRDPDYPDPINYFRAGRDILILRTFSKVYGLAGIRIGYGIAKPDIIQALMKVRIPFNVNRLGQIAALAALEDSEHIKRSVEVNEGGKSYLYKELERLGLFYLKSHTNFIFVDVGRDSTQVSDGLQRMGVITRPVKEYNFPTALRITVGSPKQNSRLIEALEKVLKA
jgi:histidinol-phosphate aminotransferase